MTWRLTRRKSSTENEVPCLSGVQWHARGDESGSDSPESLISAARCLGGVQRGSVTLKGVGILCKPFWCIRILFTVQNLHTHSHTSRRATRPQGLFLACAEHAKGQGRQRRQLQAELGGRCLQPSVLQGLCHHLAAMCHVSRTSRGDIPGASRIPQALRCHHARRRRGRLDDRRHACAERC